MAPFQKMIVPIDFSPHSEKGLLYAIDLAKSLGSTLHVLHALHFPAEIPASSIWWADLRGKALAGLAHAQQKAADAGVPCETHLADDPPVDAILDLAKSQQADLIVMGSRGLTGLAHLLLGSTAERVLRLAPCPVMTLHAGEEPAS